MEPKPFASLSSGLLARKGAARPAMRPQGFGQGGAGLEDLGWNDMGFEPPRPTSVGGEGAEPQPLRNPLSGLTPIQSPVHSQQAEIADRLSGADEAEDAFDEEYDETAEPLELDSASEIPASFDSDPVAEAEAEAEPDEPVDPGYSPVMVKRPSAASTPMATASVPVAAPEAAPEPPPVRARATRSRAAPGSKSKAAFTLRLDPDRHLKLRLACAVSGRSAQLLVTDALDALLSGMPELDAMAERAKRKG